MNIAIIGAGSVGGNLGATLSKAGYAVCFGGEEGHDASELLARFAANARASSYSMPVPTRPRYQGGTASLFDNQGTLAAAPTTRPARTPARIPSAPGCAEKNCCVAGAFND